MIGRGGGIDWGTFFRGLERGHLWAYATLLALIAGAVAAIWAGASMMKKESR